MGHFEVKACAISSGEVATQECFDGNPLVFVSDELYDAPPHSLYPGRAYIPISLSLTVQQERPMTITSFIIGFSLPLAFIEFSS